MRLLLCTGLLLFVVAGTLVTHAQDTHPLDGLSREMVAGQKWQCSSQGLVVYRGETLRYHTPLLIHPNFRERLRKFEHIVAQTALEVYGRTPKRIRHLGTYNCRRIRAYPNLISEHALGNAIDFEGFDFGPAPATLSKPNALPKALRRSFQVRMLAHWHPKSKSHAVHSLFLQTLARKLIQKEDIFRVMLGPAWPGHRNHFHFDCAPYRLVAIFE